MKVRHKKALSSLLALGWLLALTGCFGDNEAPEGLALTPPGNGPKIKWDLDARPFPEVPFPNDVATKLDSSSPTGRRLNVSVIAPLAMESDLRKKLDQLTGFGILGQLTVSFDQPLDLNVIIDRHQKNNDFDDDAIFLINLNPRSPNYGKAVLLDLGKGNFPLQLERNNNYFPNDTRPDGSNLMLETYDEDVNDNGVFDPYIDLDTDFDGIFDLPNVFKNGAWENAPTERESYRNLITFYERETNTLIIRPVLALEEESEYAVVLTKRLTGLPGPDGRAEPVRSPFSYINHTQQTEDLKPLRTILRRYGLSMKDVAFCWKFTTGSITREMVSIRRGLYGHGPLGWLGRRFPAELSNLVNFQFVPGMATPYLVKAADLIGLLELLIAAGLGDELGISAADIQPLLDSYKYVDYFWFGTYRSPDFLVDRDGIATEKYPADDDEIFDVDPRTGRAVVGESEMTFLCTVPKPNYRLEEIIRNSSGGNLDHSQILLHLDHRLGTAFVDSEQGSINRELVSFSSDAGARVYHILFGSTTDFSVTYEYGTTVTDTGNVSTDFTTSDGWISIPAGAWNGTFANGDPGIIEIEPYIDPITGPFSQTYTVTFTSSTNFTVTDGSGAPQGESAISLDFTTEDGWLTIPAAAWSGSFANEDVFEIKTVAMRPPYPVVIEGHGYTSMKFEMLGFAGNLAKHGLAVCDVDAVGHGVGLPQEIMQIIEDLKADKCFPPPDQQWEMICNAVDPLIAMIQGRARDLNNDGVPDSGGDFWTADTFHTRDIVRQTIIDQMQLVRVLRGFNGQRTWRWDTNQNGQADDLAGDINGDGEVDLGGWTQDYHTWGISLGGILSGFLAGIEPAITSAAPVSGGAGLVDIAARSTQGGVVEAVFLRLFGPIVLGENVGGGQIRLRFMIPDVNNKGVVDIGLTNQIESGDKVVVRNLKTGEERYAIAAANGNFRVHIPADAVNAVEKRAILGWDPDYVPGDTCRPYCDVDNPLLLGDPLVIEVYTGRNGPLKQTINTWLQDSKWQGTWYVERTPLVAPHEGFGHYRQTPDFRRFIGIAQTIMDPADPGSYAVHYHAPADQPTAPNSYYIFPGPFDFSDIEPDIVMGANVLVIPTIGDTNVPQNTGIANARYANMIELFENDSRYGKPQNQVIIDNFVYEGVEKITDFFPTAAAGNWYRNYHILFDLDDLDEGGKCDYANFNQCVDAPYQDYICTVDGSTSAELACADGYNAPVLKAVNGTWAPLRITVPTATGVAGMRMPYMEPTGRHGFDVPHPSQPFDISLYNINMIGRYFQSKGRVILDDICLEDDSCVHIPPPPE